MITSFRTSSFRRTLAVALALALLALFSLTVSAAKPPITLTVKPQTVVAGGKVTLEIRLNKVKNAMLNGESLDGDKIKKTFTPAKDTTFTVTATDSKGNPVTESVTVKVTGGPAGSTPTPTPAPLADLAITDANYRTEPIAGDSKKVDVIVEFDYVNRGTKVVTDPYLAYLFDGNDVKATVAGPPLSPGNALHGFFRIGVPTGQSYRWTISLDPTNRIPEITKDNNIYTVYVSTRPPKVLDSLRNDKVIPFLLKDKPSPFLNP